MYPPCRLGNGGDSVQLFFRGVDIAPKVGISKASIIDSAGGQLDSVEVVFADPEGLWSGWDPQLGDSIRLAQIALTPVSAMWISGPSARGFKSAGGFPPGWF